MKRASAGQRYEIEGLLSFLGRTEAWLEQHRDRIGAAADLEGPLTLDEISADDAAEVIEILKYDTERAGA